MSLTDQISSLLGFSSRAEAQLKSIADAQAKSSELAAQVSDLTAKASKLETDLAAANTTNAALTAKIADLEAKVTAEGKRANEVLASQGIDPNKLPETTPAAAAEPGKPKVSAKQQYVALLASNPRAAGAFYEANANEILASKN